MLWKHANTQNTQNFGLLKNKITKNKSSLNLLFLCVLCVCVVFKEKKFFSMKEIQQ